MLSGLEIFFVIFLIVVAVGLVVFFLILKLKFSKEESDNDIVWNLATNNCNKRSTGVLQDIKVGRKGRKLIMYEPKDVNGDSNDVEETIRVISDKVIEIPRGDTSKDRGIKIIFPKNPEEFADAIKNDPSFGKQFVKSVEDKNLSNNIIEALREGRDRQDALRILQGGGEVSKAEAKRFGELFDEMSQLFAKSMEKKPGG